MILESSDVQRDLHEQVDVVVIGSGCGGATISEELAAAGHSVLLLERGGYYTAARGDFDQRSDDMLARITGGRGLETTANGQLALMYGNCVGGASVHYWADSWRLPDDRAARYAELGVEGHETADLAAHFERIERDLNVHPAPPQLYNRMNHLFDEGARRLGWHVEPVRQARRGCVRSGHCYQGCAFDAKQSQLVTHIPRALEAGARLFADCQVEAILTDERGRASGLRAVFLDRTTNRPSGHRLEVRSRVVVLAAGGFASAAIWLRSGLPNGSGQVGRNLACNPCPFLHAIFPDPVEQWTNIPAATGTMDFRLARFEDGRYREGGYLLHPNQLQPEFLAATLPGFGLEHRKLMDLLPRMGGAVAWIDDELPGSIEIDGEGRVLHRFRIRGVDELKTRDALKKQALLLLAAGATEVIVPDLRGTRIRDEDDIAALDRIDLTDGGMIFGAPHPAGALRMGSDTRTSVVDSKHEAHEVPGLFVADPIAFPLPPSVDPSLTIMAWSIVAAGAVSGRLG
ncbi:MAG: GMC family oxidoreductase N-terminal domain-containing protein [Myxococcota bacterium]